jgi:two-component system OmpR family response regulator
MDETQVKKSVLIIDDEPSVRDMYSQALTSAGFGVLTAVDGVSGISEAISHRPDLILLDVHLPGMDGFEMLKTLRAKDDWAANVPVIFLTNDAATSEAVNTQIAEAGVAYYLIKSTTDLSDLVDKIRQVLGIAA